MTQDEVASLSGSAAKLLVYRAIRGVERADAAAEAAGAGLSRATYFRAKAELEALTDQALVSLMRRQSLTSETPVSPLRLPSLTTETPVSPMRPESPERLTGETAPLIGGLGLMGGEGIFPPTNSFHDTARVPVESDKFSPVLPQTPRQQCAEADRLPGDGDPTRPTSEFQARRRAQVAALQGAWRALFPQQNELTALSAKQLLALAGNVAEDVLDALELAKARNIEFPLGYARKVLADTPKQPSTARTSGPRQTQAAAAEDHSGEMLEWTPEYEERTRRGEEKLRRMPEYAWVLEETE